MSNGSPARTKLKIVFDTNIYISAFLKSGFSREILNLAFLGRINLFISTPILLELKEKLRKKFKIQEGDIQLFTTTISQIAKKVLPSQKIKVIKVDPKDNIILECALEAGANLIISNDRHLLKLKRYQKVGIIHPKTLVWIFPDEFGSQPPPILL